MRHDIGRRTLAGMILVLSLCVAVHGRQPATQTPLDPAVDEILTRLEQRTVHDLRAKLIWELKYIIEEEEEPDRKFGVIWYKQRDPTAQFKVQFDSKTVGTRKRRLDEQHLFDGRWYIELQSKTKTVTRREIRAENEKANPYKLGEGAFPLPFGQKKADILAEFDVKLIAPKKKDPPNTDHLRLTPRPGTSTGRTYKTLDFWIADAGKLSGLPLKVVAGKRDGAGAVNSLIAVTFSDVELNPGLSASVFEIITPSGYEEIIERIEPIAVPPQSSP